MLPHVCYPDVVGRTLHDLGVAVGPDPSEPIVIDVVSYRPGRRAVLRASQGGRAVYLKVMQPHRTGEIVDRHERLQSAGVPVPAVIAHHNGLVVLEELPGRPLSRAVIDEWVAASSAQDRSEEHTSELQSRGQLVYRPLHEQRIIQNKKRIRATKQYDP